MFSDFYFSLKRKGAPVSIQEWLALHDALDKGLAKSSLVSFYYLARALMVKSELHFDQYDLAFLETFGDIETSDEILEKIYEGMREVPELKLSPEELARLEREDLEQVRANFERQLREGHYREHVGGSKAIGTGGVSTQGAFGQNPAGVRVGQHVSRNRSAVQIADKRAFRNYSSDAIVDTRSMKVALSRLRTLLPVGPLNELDLPVTIDETCRNAGELELRWKRDRRNAIKALLLMDTGGSMDHHVRLCNRLFSAAKSQLSKLKHLYFHNCIYQDMWRDMEQGDSVKTEEVLRTFGEDYKVILVGDAAMAPSELLYKNGAIDYWYENPLPGVDWLMKVAAHFKNCVWLNPEPEANWGYSQSTQIVRDIFPMYPLTVEGLDAAVKRLLRRAPGVFSDSAFQNECYDRYLQFYQTGKSFRPRYAEAFARH